MADVQRVIKDQMVVELKLSLRSETSAASRKTNQLNSRELSVGSLYPSCVAPPGGRVLLALYTHT